MTLTQLAAKLLSEIADEQIEFILEQLEEFNDDTDNESEILIEEGF